MPTGIYGALNWDNLNKANKLRHKEEEVDLSGPRVASW